MIFTRKKKLVVLGNCSGCCIGFRMLLHRGIFFAHAIANNGITRMQFNEKNREDFTSLRTKYEEEKELQENKSSISPVALMSRSDDKQYLDEEVDLLFDIGFSVLDMIEEEVDEDIIMQHFVDSLNKEQENELIAILSSVNENIDKMKVEKIWT